MSDNFSRKIKNKKRNLIKILTEIDKKKESKKMHKRFKPNAQVMISIEMYP